MAKGLIRLQEELHHKLLKLRTVDAIIQRPSFERLWDESDDQARADVALLITNNKPEAIRGWMRHHPSLGLEEKSLTILRGIALRLGLRRISRMCKYELIDAISKRENYVAQ